MEKMTNLNHLRMEAERSRECSAQVAAAALAAIEELSDQLITIEQVNTAIDTAITGAIEEAY